MPNKPNAPETIELTENELRAIAGYAADCASPVLTLFERDLPSDTRPRDAVDAARVFAAGGPRTDALRQSAWAAFKAAREPSLSPRRPTRLVRRAMPLPPPICIPGRALIR